MNNINQLNNFNNDEIDLLIIIKLFFRNKILISSISFIFFIIACLFSLTKERVWEGRFEIVVNTKKQNDKNMNSKFLQLAGFQNNENDLNTEVAILESQSVLMPVFEFANSFNKNSEFKSLYSNFSGWKNSKLKIKLVKGTSVLRISYRDTNQESIIPILNEITSTYQKYSGRNKKRKQNLANKYLKNQINLFRTKSSNSLKVAQSFAIDKDLNDFQGLSYLDNVTKSTNNKSELPYPNIDIESIRVQSANEIRKIDLQILKIEEIENDLSKIQYISSIIPELRNDPLFLKLSNLEEDLIERKSKYTLEDFGISRLIERKNLLIDLLTKRTIGYLQSRRLVAESQMQASMRPKGILLEYKELIRNAQRDESTLVLLENQLRSVELDQAKIEDPWELITKPTLIPFPVEPSRKKIGLLGLISGVIIGTISAYIKEKKLDIIFDIRTIEKDLNTKVIEDISIENSNIKSERISYIKDILISKIKNKITFLTLGEINIVNKESLKRMIKDIDKNNEKIRFIDYGQNLDMFASAKERILILSPGKLKNSDIENLNKRLKILEISCSGIIIV